MVELSALATSALISAQARVDEVLLRLTKIMAMAPARQRVGFGIAVRLDRAAAPMNPKHHRLSEIRVQHQ
jgi:hypothetical protein